MQEPRTRPATATVSTDRQACFWYNGTGRVPNDDHERYDRCDSCGGTGVRKSSPAIRPLGQPSAQPVATAA